MSLRTMAMVETFPAQDILTEIEHLEENADKLVSHFASLVYHAYHRGCREQQVRCVVQLMYHEQKTYEEATSVLNYPLVQGINLRQSVDEYYPVYARMQERGGESG